MNIDIGSLTKPATVLVKKVAAACGVLYEPRRIIRHAHAEAEAEKIAALAQVEVDEIQQRGLQRMIHLEGRRQENIEAITAQAVQSIPEDAQTEQLDEDWIVHFFGQCSDISDKKMQVLWSRILAGEATKPGNYSKHTINALAEMDKTEAELFTTLCQFIWQFDPYSGPLVFDVDHDIYKNQGITFLSLTELDSLGFIMYNAVGLNVISPSKNPDSMSYFNNAVYLEFDKASGNQISIGHVLFSPIGRQLASIVNVEPNKEFYTYCLSQFRNAGIAVHEKFD